MFDANDLELLSAYLDDALTAEERAALEARLETEAGLRRELARLRATIDLIGTLPTLPAPRDFRLTPRMVRRPSIITSAAFSAMSAAAAIILLVIGATLFSVRSPQAPPAAAELAFAPTTLPMTASAGRDDTASAVSEAANAAEETDLKSEAAPLTDGLLLALPTGTPAATLLPPMLYAEQETEDTFGTLAMQADAAVQQSQDDQLRYASEQPAPSSAAGGAAAQASLPQPTLAPTEKPSITPSPVSTATHPPSATPTTAPTSTLLPTTAPTLVPPSSAAENTNTVGVALIVVALLLFGVAVVTTLLRRRV